MKKPINIWKTQLVTLSNALETILKFDRELEFARIDLCLRDDFNLAVAFWIFDKNSVGWISYLDLKEGFHDLGILASDVQCKLIVKQYDLDFNGKLTFEEFNTIFTPQKEEY